MTYQHFLAGLALRHFTPAEVAFLGAQNQDLRLNREPHEDLWNNVVRVAWLADQVRSATRSRIRILSGYRNNAYNTAIGGASRSLHKDNMALDLDPLDITARQLFNWLNGWRAAGVWKGGLGLYNSFVHVDTRGSNATWGI